MRFKHVEFEGIDTILNEFGETSLKTETVWMIKRCVFRATHSEFISVDICSEGLNRLFFDKVLMPAKIFRNTGKLIPFLFGGANMSSKMQSKDQLAFL